jgi:hypothetical protein
MPACAPPTPNPTPPATRDAARALALPSATASSRYTVLSNEPPRIDLPAIPGITLPSQMPLGRNYASPRPAGHAAAPGGRIAPAVNAAEPASPPAASSAPAASRPSSSTSPRPT